MESQKKTYNRWTHIKVQALLSIYAEENIQQELESMTRNKKKSASKYAQGWVNSTLSKLPNRLKKKKINK